MSTGTTVTTGQRIGLVLGVAVVVGVITYVLIRIGVPAEAAAVGSLVFGFGLADSGLKWLEKRTTTQRMSRQDDLSSGS